MAKMFETLGITTKIVDRIIASSGECLKIIEKAVVSQTTYQKVYLEFAKCLLLLRHKQRLPTQFVVVPEIIINN